MDTWCRQVLRSTVGSEILAGPGRPRCNVDRDTGNGVLQARWWPVTEVLAVQVSAAQSFPPSWTPVPAGQWRIRRPLIPVGDSASATAPGGGTTVEVAPGWVSWCPPLPAAGLSAAGGSWPRGSGRGGTLVQLSYVNGWPHTSLTAPAAAGATVLSVDDVTGWPGASGFVYDGAATEQVSGLSAVAADPVVLPGGAGTAQGGPGTITMSAPLAYAHEAGTVVSALPATVIDATILAAAVQALTGGTDAITIQSVSGQHSSPQKATDDMTKTYQAMLGDFRRII